MQNLGSRTVGALLLGLLASSFLSPLSADDWAWPEPMSFHSRGFGYVAEIFPAKSRQNSSEKPFCYFYAMEYAGTGWEVKPKLLWKAVLANPGAPYEAVVSMEGDLVTLNEHGHLGFENAVVIYGRDGKLVKNFSLDELLSREELEDTEKVSRSTSSRWWNQKAAYYFLASPARFYVVLPWGKALKFRLANGEMRPGKFADFAELAAVRRNSSANEMIEPWRTSLRFSSITDVVAERGKRK